MDNVIAGLTGDLLKIKMKKILITLTAVALAACTTRPAFDPASVADATSEQVARVEPLSWWTGMKMPLQLLVQGEGISEYNVEIEGGKGVSFIHQCPEAAWLGTMSIIIFRSFS